MLELQQSLCIWDGAEPRPLQLDADIKGTARRILELEEQIPVERLRLSFFSEREAWRSRLVDAPDYGIVLQHIDQLKEAVSVPATRVLVQQVLARIVIQPRNLHMPLAREIVHFAVPTLDFILPSPLKGWEFGELDLAQLRSHAAAEASRIPDIIHTMTGRPTKFGARSDWVPKFGRYADAGRSLDPSFSNDTF